MRRASNGKIMMKKSIIVILLISIVFTLVSCSKGQTEATKNQSQQGGAHNEQTQNGVKPLSYEDFTIMDFTPGQSLLALQQTGTPKPQKVVTTQNNTIYYYSSTEVTVSAQNRIVGIVSDNPQNATRRGIHPGSSVEEVKNAYGSSPTVTTYDEYTLLEYTYFAMPEQKLILRFAVKTGSETVNYIGSRILGEDQIKRTIFDEIKSEDITGTWWTDLGYWAFKLELNVTQGEVVGKHAGNSRYGAKIEKEPNEPSIRGVFNNTSPVKVTFKSGNAEGVALITLLNKDCIWWHIVSVDKVNDSFIIPHEAVMYRQK